VINILFNSGTSHTQHTKNYNNMKQLLINNILSMYSYIYSVFPHKGSELSEFTMYQLFAEQDRLIDILKNSI